MNPCRFVIVALLSGAACLDMPAATPDAVHCPPPPDLAQTLPKCAAAKGLAGDNLVCADFNQIPSLPDAQRLPGWDFICPNGVSWTTSGGMLQINNFGSFKDDCTVKLPSLSLSDPDKAKYKSFSLSLIHRIDLSDPEQKAFIFLTDSSDQTRLLYFATGKKIPARQQTTITLDRADLPALLTSILWQLKISSALTVPRQGWQIESIAVNGVP
jgi:hypothetical protein